MLALGDPVGTGLVNSLARPGGNVTGASMMVSELAAKRLELLKTVVPRISRVLVLAYLADPIAPLQVKAVKEAARSLGVMLQVPPMTFRPHSMLEPGSMRRGSLSVPKAYSSFTAHESANSRPITDCQRCTRIRSKLLTPVA
jgi:ABC transporter substrate binding protein